MTRVAVLGELTASIAHEINQPLAAVVNNASACVRWLATHNLELNLLINAIEAISEVSEGPRELWVSSQKFTKMPARGTRALQTGESEEDELAARALAEGDGTYVLIAVRDSGPGLDPKDFDRLFDAFYTTKPQGLGMGLAISRSIIEAHGGRLWAKANAPRGAVFQFTLPIREERML